MEKTKDAESTWREKCRVEGITVDSCPRSGPFRYEKLYANHVASSYRGWFKNWDHYQAAKAAYTKAVSAPLE
eukprot:2731485-Pyramimonas_sp.AAC.1